MGETMGWEVSDGSRGFTAYRERGRPAFRAPDSSISGLVRRLVTALDSDGEFHSGSPNVYLDFAPDDRRLRVIPLHTHPGRFA